MASSLRQSSTAPINFFSLIDIITGVTGVLILATLLLATKVNPRINAGGLPEDEPDPALRQQLNQLLSDMATLNIQNQQLQRTVAAVEAAPSVASLKQEVEDLHDQKSSAEQRVADLRGSFDRLSRTARERDAKLGLSEMSQKIEELQKDLVKLQQKSQTATEDMARWEAEAREAEARLLQVQRELNKLWVIPEPSRTSKEPLLVVVSDSSVTIERFNKPENKITLHVPSEREFRAALASYSSLDYYVVFYVKPSGIPSFDRFKESTKRDGYEVGYDAVEEQVEVMFSSQK